MPNTKYQISNTNTRGFSFIELLLSVAILAILSSGVIIWFVEYQRQSELDSAAKTIVDAARDAQSRSMSGKDFKNWGVYFDLAGNKFILFRDEDGGYATATAKEENYLSGFVKIGSVTLNGGGSETVFNKPKGDTSQYGTANGNSTAVRLEQANNSNNYKNIIITSLGRIDIQ
jgi:prepilin-type N-terminal cleavage/methylation domain-containing protein